MSGAEAGSPGWRARATGATLAALTLCVIGAEWGGVAPAQTAADVLALAAVLLLLPGPGRTAKIFFAVAAGLAVAVALVHGPHWAEYSVGLQKTAFIGAFFTALATLRHAADTSPAITRCGQFLARQPPGRRYLALTTGAHLFALLLNYGAIALLGSLAVASAREEADPELRYHRTRRMLLAIQRGFISSLPWSPLAFAMAITTSLIPGASWAGAVLPCLVSTLVFIGAGWGLDTIFKPKLSRPPPARRAPEGDWSLMWPLLGLLAILVVAVGGLHLLTGLRAVAVVMLVVPLISVGWVMIQAERSPVRHLLARGGGFLVRDMPGYRGELLLIMMAGFIGTLGARLLVPVIEASGLDIAALPGWLVLLALFWAVPLAGQIGANPILAVSLIAPVLPEAAALGLDPTDFVVAITGGWALSGATSPYTATTMLVGNFAGVSARRVGLNWNGGYILATGSVLSAWVLIFAAL
ncbi:hypothetical protein P1J78_20815 [Psychromarinibacter sp. C21-152]|uniref:H+/citrate symporter n=1 Tax=Psychromarinibacter sediminicola TaxID=3033385 RepID=A0AAE3NW38_9RHOB|nr:hypothetical protein [Psychromarinibacter sediminicola]MDF0603191.1 hypothetical protein [Psychromarinibacter sediminicola]